MKILLPLIVILLASPVVHSEEHRLDPTSLRTWCAGDRSSRSFCIGYLMGVHGTLQQGVDGVACNMDATGERLRLTYIDETFKHPELLDQTPVLAIAGALTHGGVCKLVPSSRRAGQPIS